MSEAKLQSYKNHAKTDPWFHFFLIGIFLISFIASIVYLVRHPSLLAAWLVVLAFAMVVLALKVRMYSLKVQDRIIRLEERLRLYALLNDPLRSRIHELTEDQLIGLRFAPDEEIPELVNRALHERLTRKQIKQAIINWRADHWRV
ncbi:MAG: DUF6526 family protein [Acidobacteriaceae bacterium]